MFFLHYPLLYIPRLRTKVHPDLEQLSLILGKRQSVSLLLNLPQRLLCRAIQLELHHIDEAPGLQQQIDASLRSVVLRLDVEADQLEHDEKHVLVVKLKVAGQLVGSVGKEALQAAEESVVVSGLDLVHELHDLERRFYLVHIRIIRQQVLHETLFHLLVGEAQPVNAEAGVEALDGEVAALVNHRYRIRRTGVDAVQHIGAGLFVCHAVEVVMMLFQQLHQVGRRAGLEPVAAEFLLGKGVEQAEGVVNPDGVFRKVIAVIAFFQLLAGFLRGDMLCAGDLVDLIFEIAVQLLIRDAADVYVAVVHRDVVQVVKVAEHADFAELGDTRQQGEADVLVHALHHAVKGFQRFAVLFLKGIVADGLKHGFVVFVYEDHHALSGLFGGKADEGEEAVFGGEVGAGRAVSCFVKQQLAVEQADQVVGRIELLGVQVEMQDGMLRPILFQLFDGQAGKQLFLSLEIGFEGRDQKAFAETAGTAQEVIFSGRGYIINHF